MVRNTLKYVADKDKKAFANDLKTIYHAPDEQTALARLDEVRTVWEAKYPGCMNRWRDNWDCISPMFKFSQTARKVMYTTNAIESLNSGFRRLNRGRRQKNGPCPFATGGRSMRSWTSCTPAG